MRIYIIRHADPDYPNSTITEDGHQEAEVLAKRLKTYDIDKIYCSTLGRARDTMKYTADLLNIEPEIRDWLKEVYDPLKLEDTPWGTIAAWNLPGEIIRNNENMPERNEWYDIDHLGDQKEKIIKTYEQIKNKSDNFFESLGYKRIDGRYKIKDSSKEQIAVFTHGGFTRCWLAHLLEIPLPLVWCGFWFPPSSVTTILFEEKSDKWATPRCISLADTSHLYKAGLEVKSRGIISNYY